jgi:hypothetical protein
MMNDSPASDMVVGAGEMIKYAFNLRGEPIGPRNHTGPTSYGAHTGNCDVDGNYVVENDIQHGADWFYMSFCSAHLEQKHQWGEGMGVEDDIFLPNEEWQNWKPGMEFVGLSVRIKNCKASSIFMQ